MSDIKPVLRHFFVDGVKYDTEKSQLSGVEIKAIASVPGNYQLFLEEKGDKPDRAISDAENIPIVNGMHFYSVPPATFG